MGKPNPDTNKAELGEIERLRAELAAAKEKLAEYEQGYWGRMAGRNRREANNLRILLRDIANGKTYSVFEGNLDDRIKAALSVDVEPGVLVDRAEAEEALLWLDDFVARCNGDDRGSCPAVETLRTALAQKF